MQGRIGVDPAQCTGWTKVSQRKKVNFPCITLLLVNAAWRMKASQRKKVNFPSIMSLLVNRLDRGK